MSEQLTSEQIAALRALALEDLEALSDAELREETAADGEDLESIAAEMKMALLSAAESARREIMRQHRKPLGSVGKDGPGVPERRVETARAGSKEWRELGREKAACHTDNGSDAAEAVPWPKSFWRGLVLPGGAAMVMTLCALLFLHWKDAGNAPRVYSTRVGQSVSVRLPDGSSAELNTATRLAWLPSDTSREVRLEQGEVYFEVVHDSRHPFRIFVDGSEVRVLGTRFNIYRKTNGNVVVTVLNGRVSVEGFADRSRRPAWSVVLTQNQQLEYPPGGAPPADPHAVDAQQATEWRNGMVFIEDALLTELVAELNRYSERPIVTDARVSTLHVGGTFNLRDVPGTLRRIARVADLSVVETPSGYLVKYPDSVGSGRRPGRR